mmetsp:Transcript_16816/g.55170  ORF Transcript_16816/g.55170 Transcript_16816/m.55170 type:complete len:208 (+) Transcript_16816:1788-2411(+)
MRTQSRVDTIPPVDRERAIGRSSAAGAAVRAASTSDVLGAATKSNIGDGVASQAGSRGRLERRIRRPTSSSSPRVVEADPADREGDPAQEAERGDVAEDDARGQRREDDRPRLRDGVQHVAAGGDGQRDQDRARRLERHHEPHPRRAEGGEQGGGRGRHSSRPEDGRRADGGRDGEPEGDHRRQLHVADPQVAAWLAQLPLVRDVCE